MLGNPQLSRTQLVRLRSRNARSFSIGEKLFLVVNQITDALEDLSLNIPAVTTPLRQRTYNRLRAIMAHINYLSIEGQTRLAREAGVSPSVVSRIARGLSSPSFAVVLALTRALEKRLGKCIDPRDILNFDGEYPTPSVCELCDCSGCLPDSFYSDADEIKPEYRGIAPHAWPELHASQTATEEGL